MTVNSSHLLETQALQAEFDQFEQFVASLSFWANEDGQRASEALQVMRRTYQAATTFLERYSIDSAPLLRWIQSPRLDDVPQLALLLAQVSVRFKLARERMIWEIEAAQAATASAGPAGDDGTGTSPIQPPKWSRLSRQLVVDGAPITVARRDAPSQFAILDVLENAGWLPEGADVPRDLRRSLKDGVEAINKTIASTRLRIRRLENNLKVGWSFLPV